MYWVFIAGAECIYARFTYGWSIILSIVLLYYLYIINYYLYHFDIFSCITMCELHVYKITFQSIFNCIIGN